MKIESTKIADVKLIHQFRAEDNRGYFVKNFHNTSLLNAGIEFYLKESFYSVSHKNIIRGMHYHSAPYQHDKIVFCTSGSILDVALDIRKESPTYGEYVTATLSAKNNCALYIPKGFAHGFLSLEENTCTFYLQSGEYNQKHDEGFLYNSFGMDWGDQDYILSERDLSFNKFIK